MKQIVKIALGAIAALCVCSCEKENGNPADELLATITDNCISYGGVEYKIEGYIRRAPVENGVENWIVDLGCYDDKTGSSAHGILQGNYMGKKYDLANPTGDEFTFRMVCYNEGQEEAVGFIVIREYGETNSYVGIDPWEPTEKGSCFTSGKIESSFDPQKKTCKIEVAGVLKDGTSIAIKLNGAYLDD